MEKKSSEKKKKVEIDHPKSHNDNNRINSAKHPTQRQNSKSDLAQIKPPTLEEIQQFAQSQNINVEGRDVFDILKESIVKIKKSLEIMNAKTF